MLSGQPRNHAPRQLVEDADAGAERHEGALERVVGVDAVEDEADALHRGLLEADGGLQPQPLGHLQLLEPEARQAAGARRVEQAVALEAQRRGPLVPEVHAHGAPQLAQPGHDGLVLHLQAALGLPVLELRADLRRLVGLVEMELVVGVPGRAQPEADRLHPGAAHAPFAARLQLVLQQVDVGAVLQGLLARDAVDGS